MAQYVIDNIDLPINFQESEFTLRTIQNAKNLLMCHMWEVPYDRYRGFNRDIYDLPMPELKAELMPELDRIMMWEPDVEVVDADAEMLKDGTVKITVTIEVTDED